MSDPCGFVWEESNTKWKQCSISGMSQRAFFIRCGLTTAISTFFNNRHRRPREPGTWFRSGKRKRHADRSAANLPGRTEARACQDGLVGIAWTRFTDNGDKSQGIGHAQSELELPTNGMVRRRYPASRLGIKR